MKLRLFAALAAMAVLVGLMAVPASANPGVQALVVFAGEATVCANNGVADEEGGPASCTVSEDEKKGIPSDTSGNGLYLPFARGDNPGPFFTKRVGSWRFTSETGPVTECVAAGPVKADVDTLPPPIPGTLAEALALFGNPVLDTACSIEAEGRLGPAFGIGAACGISHGYHGDGEVILEDDLFGTPTHVFNIKNVGWLTSAGGTLPIFGHHDEKLDDKKEGPLVGVVQAQGGAACITDAGATLFNVVGWAALL